eukprot:15450879-Alexandrium_andersonii.AAC.1
MRVNVDTIQINQPTELVAGCQQGLLKRPMSGRHRLALSYVQGKERVGVDGHPAERSDSGPLGDKRTGPLEGCEKAQHL